MSGYSRQIWKQVNTIESHTTNEVSLVVRLETQSNYEQINDEKYIMIINYSHNVFADMSTSKPDTCFHIVITHLGKLVFVGSARLQELLFTHTCIVLDLVIIGDQSDKK